MTDPLAQFESHGYCVQPNVLNTRLLKTLIDASPSTLRSGSRLLLSIPAFRELAAHLRSLSPFAPVLRGLVCVQGILFSKTTRHNWGVRPHRDSILPIRGQGEWVRTGVKEGRESARVPRDVMDRCVALRVQLDGAEVEDVCVVPGSHLDDESHDRSESIAVPVPKGGALLMRPSLVHCSHRLHASASRRVVHLVYAPRKLPDKYEWYDAV